MKSLKYFADRLEKHPVLHRIDQCQRPVQKKKEEEEKKCFPFMNEQRAIICRKRSERSRDRGPKTCKSEAQRFAWPSKPLILFIHPTFPL